MNPPPENFPPFLFPDDLLNQVEFHRIITEIQQFCQTGSGIEKLHEIDLLTDENKISFELSLCIELKDYLLTGSPFIIDDFTDLSEKTLLLNIEGYVMERADLFSMYQFILNYQSVFKQIQTNHEKLPLIFSVFQQTGFEKKCPEYFDKVFDDQGDVKDTASKKLSEIRKQIKIIEKQAEAEFEKILQHARKNEWLSDEEQSIRHGDRVLAIKSKFKRNIKGIYIDESGSGKTLFIQPLLIIELQNRIMRLKQEENTEINHIIKDLCREISPYAASFSSYYKLMIHFDVLLAKAKFALHYHCSKPVFSQKPLIHLVNAYHPVLYIKNRQYERHTVPLNLNLSSESRIMIISGPNAGGKTIALKTVCLIQIMLMAGFPVPVEPQSEIYLFQKIITDFGDNQSIDNELSTYSARLKTYYLLMQNADEKTLFLLDEFGSGTEPQVGGAVAEGILEKLIRRNSFGLVATHYLNLKNMAFSFSEIINAAMLFDHKTLTPSYRLETGKAGSSYTYEILKNAGFDNEFIDFIKNKGNQLLFRYDQILSELSKEKKENEKLQEKLKLALQETASMLSEYRKLKENYQNRMKEQKALSKEKAQQYLTDLKRHFEKLISQWEKQKDEAVKKQKASEIISKIAEKKQLIRTQDTEVVRSEKNPVSTGDWAKISGSNMTGYIESINKEVATLVFENQRLKISVNLLEKTVRPDPSVTSNKIIRTKTKEEIPLLQIDVRGMRKEEALEKIEEFVDNALINRVHTLRIIHGTGKGILKDAIQQHLRKFTFVTKIAFEEPERGGEGVTVIEIN
ncbi:MAG TPA: Smr/MutS family protein [Bacteroidia bacterium]|nr:Smr/MutS family protein [Bacteroidia bacterium]HRS57848.1 Smr/MutS family protein [Bacteroidia bacterium]HRU67812.1 Smr/MutS family protein [Bacteroidia bacterium]